MSDRKKDEEGRERHSLQEGGPFPEQRSGGRGRNPHRRVLFFREQKATDIERQKKRGNIEGGRGNDTLKPYTFKVQRKKRFERGDCRQVYS